MIGPNLLISQTTICDLLTAHSNITVVASQRLLADQIVFSAAIVLGSKAEHMSVVGLPLLSRGRLTVLNRKGDGTPD